MTALNNIAYFTCSKAYEHMNWISGSVAVGEAI